VAVHTYADQINVCSAYRTSDGANSAVLLAQAASAAPEAVIVYRHELLTNNDFKSGLLGWEAGGPVEVLARQHAVRVTEKLHVHQLVPVTPGAAYRLLIRARCLQPDTFTRLQVNWVDKSGRGLPPYLLPVSCTSQWADYSSVITAPANAASGYFYVTGHTEKPVLIQHASMAW
ncbi:MAG: hypothetical protein ABSC08_14670, partial [Bryobacteraceae bacterium]